MGRIYSVVEGVMAERKIVTAQQFDYEAFNVQQGHLLDKSVRTHELLLAKPVAHKALLAKEAAKLEVEYELLMAEWLYRKSPQYATVEELCNRMSEIESQMSKLF